MTDLATTTHLPRKFSVPCTITVEHTTETLEAHVTLGNDIRTEIGDRITVHGASVAVEFGETSVFERMATVRRAGTLEKLWIRICAFFEFTELYEVSFSPGSLK
ncbi:MAG: hypothetical protein AAFY85_09670 [Pseudomonadota bacterium]